MTSTLQAARRRLVPSEHDEQVRLFQLAALHERRWPELAWLYAVPNGGHRHAAVAGKLRAEGVRRGVPDVALDVARGGYHGWRCELKRQGAPPSAVKPEQSAWHIWLREQGYRVDVCRGAEEAWAALTAYLESYSRSAILAPE